MDRRSQDLHLPWVRLGRVRHLVTRRPPAPVGTRHDARRAVRLGEVVQEPRRVADDILPRRYRSVEVRVQSLVTLSGKRAATVERVEPEIALQHLGDRGEQAWMGETDLEDRALVDEIGEPVSSPLLVDLLPRIRALQRFHDSTDYSRLAAVFLHISGGSRA